MAWEIVLTRLDEGRNRSKEPTRLFKAVRVDFPTKPTLLKNFEASFLQKKYQSRISWDECEIIHLEPPAKETKTTHDQFTSKRTLATVLNSLIRTLNTLMGKPTKQRKKERKTTPPPTWKLVRCPKWMEVEEFLGKPSEPDLVTPELDEWFASLAETRTRKRSRSDDSDDSDDSESPRKKKKSKKSKKKKKKAEVVLCQVVSADEEEEEDEEQASSEEEDEDEEQQASGEEEDGDGEQASSEDEDEDEEQASGEEEDGDGEQQASGEEEDGDGEQQASGEEEDGDGEEQHPDRSSSSSSDDSGDESYSEH